MRCTVCSLVLFRCHYEDFEWRIWAIDRFFTIQILWLSIDLWLWMNADVVKTQGLYQTKGIYRIVISDYFRRFSELEFNTSHLIDKHFYAMGLWRKIRSVIAAILPSKYHFKSKTASDFELRSKSQENFRHKISDSLILLV